MTLMQPFPVYLCYLFFPSDTRASHSALIRMTSIGASRLTHIHETLSLSLALLRHCKLRMLARGEHAHKESVQNSAAE